MRMPALSIVLILSLVAPLLAGEANAVEVQRKDILVDGRPFLVKGIHYGPWRPGSGPARGYPYPGSSEVAADLAVIRDLNVNTIYVIEPEEHVLDLAQEYGLKVLCGFFIQWWTVGPSVNEVAERPTILEAVERFKDKPALLGWVLGSEVPASVLENKGKEVIEKRLEELYRSVKAADPVHPVTHANWPVTKDLNLGFLDIVAFNVYPLWPPEVVARGFGTYIEESLQPIAGDKPLLISEFGANSLEATEAGQGRLLGECWAGLRRAGASGGIVFELADEWWKNYDNPRRAGNWWSRVESKDDEKSHDLDPEEYYGIVQADRSPKPAYAVVRQMFAEKPPVGDKTTSRGFPFLAVGILIVFAAGVWGWAIARRTRPGGGAGVKDRLD